jgi:two-component system phosphate regulon sensor histidine kinase PhoR
VERPTLKSIVDAIAQPALVLSPTYRILEVNQDAQAFFESPLQGLDVVRIMRQPEIRELLEKVSAHGARQTCEITIHRNVPRTMRVAIGPLKNGDPSSEDFLLTLTDVSGQIDAERSRSTFVANVSHELRSPLTTLMGAVETLQGPARDNEPARDRFLELMESETQRMSRLVGDLLNLAKQEAIEHVRPDAPVNLENTLRQVADALEASENYQGGRLALALEPVPTVRGSEDDLFEAFRNLIENALRYSPPESAVTVSLRHERSSSPTHGDRIIIEITDQGDGIASEHIPRLTERFYRVDKGRSREMGGTGLGLAIVKHIVNRHRGRLSFQSELGSGTTATVTLPA